MCGLMMFICVQCEQGAHKMCQGYYEFPIGIKHRCDCAVLDPDGLQHPETVSQEEYPTDDEQ